MGKKLTVLIKEPAQEPRLKEIDNDIGAIQNIVDGYVRYLTLPNIRNVICCVNEDAKLKINNYAPNLLYPITETTIIGTVVMVGVNDDGSFKSLNQKDVKKCKRYCAFYEFPQNFDIEKDKKELSIFMDSIRKDYLNEEMEM